MGCASASRGYGPYRTRTCNLLNVSQSLCQLSQRPAATSVAGQAASGNAVREERNLSARCAQQQQAGQISVWLAHAAEDFFPAGSKVLVGAVAIRKRGVEDEDVASTVGRVLRMHLQYFESGVCSTGNLK